MESINNTQSKEKKQYIPREKKLSVVQIDNFPSLISNVVAETINLPKSFCEIAENKKDEPVLPPVIVRPMIDTLNINKKEKKAYIKPEPSVNPRWGSIRTVYKEKKERPVILNEKSKVLEEPVKHYTTPLFVSQDEPIKHYTNPLFVSQDEPKQKPVKTQVLPVIQEIESTFTKLESPTRALTPKPTTISKSFGHGSGYVRTIVKKAK